MKFVYTGSGITFLHGLADDVCPTDGLLQQDLVDYVAALYSFKVRPNIPQGLTTHLPVLTFNFGKLSKDGKSYPVQQLSMLQNGDSFVSINTDFSDLIADDFMLRLDADLKYRYAEHPRTRTHHSAVVIDFDKPIEDSLPAFNRIESILNAAIPRDGTPFKPKTIAFGYGDPVQGPITGSIEAALKADFALQRRVGTPYELNRYVSAAPTSTSHHLEVLRKIEAALG